MTRSIACSATLAAVLTALTVIVILRASETEAGTVAATVASFPDLQTAISNLGGAPGVIELAPAIFPVTANYTVPSNVTLLVKEGALFSLSPSVTLTINGALQVGRFQIFSGNGTVSGTPKIEAVLPEWFYAGTLSWHSAFNQAVTFADVGRAPYGRIPVSLGPRTYDIDAPIVLLEHSIVAGVGRRSTVIRRSANDINMIDMQSFSSLRGVTVDGNTTPPPGARPGHQVRSGILIHGSPGAERDGCEITGVTVKDHLGQGISLHYAKNTRLSDVTVSGNWERGINISEFSHSNTVDNIYGSNNEKSDVIIGWGSHNNIVSNGVFELSGNTNIWIHQDSHDNSLSNVRIRLPRTSSVIGIRIWNAYKNHVTNLRISGFASGIHFQSDSITCHAPPPGSFWDDDTRDNMITNATIDGTGETAPQAVVLHADACGSKKVVDNVFANVSIDHFVDGVQTTSTQRGSTDVTRNTFQNFVLHNILSQPFNWGTQAGNFIK
jgi:hypothetical protein